MNSSFDINTHPYVIELTSAVAIASKTVESLSARISELESQVNWFTRQVFGRKSERRVDDTFPLSGEQQMLEMPLVASIPAKVELASVQAHTRKKSHKVFAEDNASHTGLRFGPEVRVEEVPVANPATKDLDPSEYEIISYRTTERLCQEKSAYFITRFIQPVIKLKSSGKPINPPVIESVIQSPYADISILVGLITDKFLYYQPLYRQHQKLQAQGIDISRGTLNTWAHAFIDLFKPIYDAQLISVLASAVISMDETPHKAGRKKGKHEMSTCYFWFLYGDMKEVILHNSISRGAAVVKNILFNNFQGTLLSDGYPVYASITELLNILHACCWAHARRYFIEAEEQEPLSSREAVALIRELYVKEELAPPEREERLEFRLEQEKPIVDRIFDWLQQESRRLAGLPKTKYSKAVHYTLSREASLRVFLFNPDVPLDNNHTERAIRSQVMARKNYLFCWTEIGAEKVAIIQSLIITCQLHEIDPWEYLTDVALRISTHPQSRVAELTPRNWKERFGKKLVPLEITESLEQAA